MATIKFEVSGTARPRRIFLDNEEIVLDAQGKGETNREVGPAKLGYLAFGAVGATLNIKMENIVPDEVKKSVQLNDPAIFGFTVVNVSDAV